MKIKSFLVFAIVATLCSCRFYIRNNTSRDASYGWSIIYDVRDMDSVYTYEGLPDWDCMIPIPIIDS